jgi:hypothetical protein
MEESLLIPGIKWTFGQGLELCAGIYQFDAFVHIAHVLGYGCVPIF